MINTNGNGVAEKKRQVFLSRASSRKDLAAMMHEAVWPMLQNHEHNLKWLKDKLDASEQKNAALEARIAALEPKTEA